MLAKLADRSTANGQMAAAGEKSLSGCGAALAWELSLVTFSQTAREGWPDGAPGGNTHSQTLLSMDVEILSRIQFAFTIAFHYIYPPLSIGLGLCLVIMEGMWLKTRNPLYHSMAWFWTKVFALTFAIGVASGIVMEFEFGTNWATYSRFVGDVFGSALAAEGIFAFFLESGFLAVLLFGWDKVGPKMHFFSTCMVCLGAHFSAIWIVVANSWQQTPAGHHWEVAGQVFPAEYRIPPELIFQSRAVIDNFWGMVFNPSSMDRLGHVILGCYLAGGTLVMSVAAYYLLKGKHKEFATASLKIGLVVTTLAALAQLFSGHRSGEIVAEHQPSKLAAMEGLWETTDNAGLTLFGWVDAKNERTIGPQIPGMLSWLAHGDTNAEVIGLDQFAPEDRPNVFWVFQFFHIMVAIGFALILITLVGVLYWWRGWLFDTDRKATRIFLWVLVLTVLLPQIANQFGWFAAEMGRQPWIVWEQLRTSDGLSAVVTAEAVLFSLIGFALIYSLLFALFIFLLNSKIHYGPTPYAEAAAEIPEIWKQRRERAEGEFGKDDNP